MTQSHRLLAFRSASQIIIGLAITWSSCATQIVRADQAASDSIRAYGARIASERDDRKRALLFYSLVGGISERKIRVTSDSEAADLTRLMAGLLDHDPDPVIRWQAAEFLAEHPHPIAADALLRAAGNHERIGILARESALTALVSLRERRVLPELLRDVADPELARNPSTFRRLSELGERAGLAPLRKVAADTSRPGFQRDAARLAERDLNLFLTARIVNSFTISDSNLAIIRRNGFVIVPSTKNEMFELYGAEYPFITSDVMYHTFMILLRASLDELERFVLRPAVADLSRQMADGSLRQAESIADPQLRGLAQRNAAAFYVAGTLLSGHPPVALSSLPSLSAIMTEVEHIRSHQDIVRSSIFGYLEDFTKYAPRGRRDSLPELEGYYQAMLYLGRMTWRAQSPQQTQQALLLLDVLAHEPRARRTWARTDSLLTQVFGERDDLTIADYERIVGAMRQRNASGRNLPTYIELAGKSSFIRALSDLLFKMAPPRIRTGAPSSPTRPSPDPTEIGLKVFGQRYTRPIQVLQDVMDRGAWPPSGLHIAATLLASPQARSILSPKDPRVASVPEEDRSVGPDPFSGLSEAWIHASRSVFEVPNGAPEFMRLGIWEEKQINSALGAWVELQHATALYVKDANVYKGGSAMLDRFHGFVEPLPEFYQRLDQLVVGYTRTMNRYSLFEQVQRDRDSVLAALGPPLSPMEASRAGSGGWGRKAKRDEAAIRIDRSLFEEFSAILERLATIATKELAGEAQTIDDGYFLKGLHRRLMYLSLNRSGTNTARTSMAIVTDVATEYQSQTCLEIAVGRPYEIYAAVPDGGRTFVCKGAVYSYYEFARPMRGRLNDEAWKKLSADPSSSSPVPWILTRQVARPTSDR